MTEAATSRDDPKAPYILKSQHNNFSRKKDFSERDLAAVGRLSAPDQGRSKLFCSAKSRAENKPLKVVDGAPAHQGEVLDTARGSTPAGTAQSTRRDNPHRWSKALEPATAAGLPAAGSDMAPGRKQQMQQEESISAQSKTQGSKTAHTTSASAASGNRGSSTMVAVPKGNGQQGLQHYNAKLDKAPRTSGNHSTEAITPKASLQSSQHGVAAAKVGDAKQSSSVAPPTASGPNMAPKTALLSYAAAAVHRQPPPMQPTAAVAHSTSSKSARPHAAPKEPFPPLAVSGQPVKEGWSSPGPSAALGGWVNGSPSSAWNRRPAEHDIGKSSSSSSQHAVEIVPPVVQAAQTRSKPGTTGSNASSGAVKTTTSTANGTSGLVMVAGGGSRQETASGQYGSHGTKGSQGGGRGKGARGVHNTHWAPRYNQPATLPVQQAAAESRAFITTACTDDASHRAAALEAAPPVQQPHMQDVGKPAQPSIKSMGHSNSSSSGDTGTRVSDSGSSSGVRPAAATASTTGMAAAVAPAVPQSTTPSLPLADAALSMQQQQQQQSSRPAVAPAAAQVPAPAAAITAAASKDGPASRQQVKPGGSGSGATAAGPVLNMAAQRTTALLDISAASNASGPNKPDMQQASKALPKPAQQQQSPSFKLPSSQAVNMAAVAARSGNSSGDSRLTSQHFPGSNHDGFGSSGYPGIGMPDYQASGMHGTGVGVNAYMPPLYSQPTPQQLPAGGVEFLLRGADISAFDGAAYAHADGAVQQYVSNSAEGTPGSSGLGTASTSLGPQIPTSVAMHMSAGGPHSSRPQSGSSAQLRASAAGTVSSNGMKRHLSADAPPFEVPRHNSRESAPAGASTASTCAADAADTGVKQHRSDRSKADAAGSSTFSTFSRQLFELAEQLQAEEHALDGALAESAKRQSDLQDKLASERAGRVAAEARLTSLEQEVETSRQSNQELRGQLSAESQQVSQLRAKVANQASEAEHAASKAATLEADLQAANERLEDALAQVSSLQQQCKRLEAEKLQLEHRMTSQAAHAARTHVADAAAANIPRPTGGLHSSGQTHGLPFGGSNSSSGLAARLPPPGFDPVPPHQQQPPQHVSGPGTPSAVFGSFAAPPADMAGAAGGAGTFQAADNPEKDEHHLVLAFLKCLPIDPNAAKLFTDAETMKVNVQLMPFNWDEHYAFKYGSMQKFMADRPMVFGVREDGAFFKYSNSEQLVQEKMAEEAEQAAAAAAGEAGLVPSVGTGCAAQLVLEHEQHREAPPPTGGQPHQLHSGPPLKPGMGMHGVSMAMSQGPPVAAVGMQSPAAPVAILPPHMAVVNMGLPFYPNHMHASAPLAGPSVPFPAGPCGVQGW